MRFLLRSLALMAASLLLTAQASFVVAVGLSALASFPLWLAFGPGDPDSWLAQLRNLHLRVGTTFLLAGLVTVALRSRARTTKNMAAGETSAGNLRLVLTAGLLILPFWAWNTSDPWLSLWRESWQLIDSLGLWNAVERGNDPLGLSFAAILAILFLPFLELGTAISFLLTSLIVLLVLWAGKRYPALTLAQCLGVQLAFLLSSFFAVDAFENLTPLLQQGLSRVEPEAIKVSAWLLRQEELAILGARQLMWHCVGYLLLTLVALSVEGRRRVRRIASNELMGEILSSAPLPMTFHEPALRENSEALLARLVSVSAPKEGEADGELGYSSYLLKPRSGLPWSLLPGRHAYAISGPAYDTTERVLWYTEATEGSIRLVRTSGEATVAIRPIGIPLRTLYEVREPHNSQLIGSLKRGDLSGAEWQWVNYEEHDMKAVLKPADEHGEGLTIVADRSIVSILLRSPTLRLQAASR